MSLYGIRYIYKLAFFLTAIIILFPGSTGVWASDDSVIIGAKQDRSSFTITEGGPGAFAARPLGYQGWLIVKCPAGVSFASMPEITVTGDLKLDIAGARLNNPTDDQLSIPVLSSSTVASTVRFDKVLLTLDRTVPEGNVTLKVGGSAIDWSSAGTDLSIQVAAAHTVLANVVTPAPDEQNAEAQFKIGDKRFILNGTETAMDVAPYIKEGRTFIPLYYAAQALGISEKGMVWDQEKQTVTLMKGLKLVQVTIGSHTMLFNGAAIELDAAPEIVNGRTCLPVALLAKALGETATWDANTYTLEIK